MDIMKQAMKALINDLGEFNYHLERLENKLKSKNNYEINALINSCEEISRVKELQTKLIRINNVY